MKPPPWLAELHRLWHKARGGKLGASARPFSLDWDAFLEKAGVKGNDLVVAPCEAETLEKQGRIELKRHKYRRHLILKIVVPMESEPWLRELYGSASAEQLLEQSLAAVDDAATDTHRRYPDLWQQWCNQIRSEFTAGRGLHPLHWRQPDDVRQLISAVKQLTETEWLPGISIRTVSTQIGLDSKELERRQDGIESALTSFFGNTTTLPSLGISDSASHASLSGPLVLHFDDGTVLDHSASSGRYSIDHVDLMRVRSIETTAQRLLTVENAKTTFRDLCAANTDRSTLIVTTSFPSASVRLLLEKLPLELPHFHFGDTDPAGWHILLKLRELSSRKVTPIHMRWRAGARPSPLTAHDRGLLPKLLASPHLEDCRNELLAIANNEDRGEFEQESLGLPSPGWPFYLRNGDAPA